MNIDSSLHVAVGEIKNSLGEILISRRNPSVYQGGLWEFPGGKVEVEESVQQALVRELQEELDIYVDKMTPLIKVRHNYPKLRVLLDVWIIQAFSGVPKACEGQPLQWVLADDLAMYAFPEANLPIITAVRLPAYYAILDGNNMDVLQISLEQILDKGIKLVQLRAKSLSAVDIERFLLFAIPRCNTAGARLLLNSALQNAYKVEIEGIHLTSKDLMGRNSRPFGYAWVGASCHTDEELLHAQKTGVDFAVLAPVMSTSTHPGAPHLGWARFSAMVSRVNIPVYALGGMCLNDASNACANGGQGVAGISMFSSDTP
jgi:8-oxo-dGTP diphosphatase